MSNDRRVTGRRLLRAVTVVGVALVAMLVFAGPAFASAWWKTTARVAPANLPTKGPGYITAQAINLGDVAISAKTSPVTITDTLPEGVTVTHLGQRRENTVNGEESAELAIWTCSETKPATRVIVKCTYDTAKAPLAEDYVVRPYENLELRMNVETNGTSGSSQNELTVEGGREASPTGEELAGEGTVPAPPPSVRSIGFDDAPTTFGLEDKGYSVTPENDKGAPESQAGAHPFQLTTSVLLNEQLETRTNGLGEIETNPAAPALTRNLHFNLPPGLLGNVTAVAQCSELQFGTINNGGGTNECPASSAIGVVRVTILEPELLAYHTLTAPVFNLTPAKGEPARFGFFVYHLPVLLDTRVRTEGDYGVEVKVTDTTELAQVLGSEVTLWGAPGAAVHDQSRGWACVAGGYWVNRSLTPCTAPSEHSSTAFLTSPTSCSGSLTSNVTGESWPLRAPGETGLGHALSLEGGSKEFTFPELPGGITGCNALPFGPTIGASPSAAEANAPIGVSVDVHVPQDSTRDAGQLGESAVKATTVTFPLGMQLSPSAANGLEACSEAQMGYIGRGATSDPYAPGTEEPMKFNTAPVGCPDASKVGTVKVKTPLLSEELAGNVYLAAQEANPFGSLLAVYIVAESENAGLRVKLAGEVKTDPVTGQVTSTFESTPQVPFEDFKVNLNSGPRASLSSPPTCGSYTTEASFTPWSTGLAQASTSPIGEFDLTSGPGGSPCSNPQPFAPGFTAGSTNLQAGAFTPFTVTITRPDTDQALRSVSVSLPPGAAAMLASATQCPEQQANEGTCGPDSLIGHATAVSGLGPNPFTVNGGRVYITGPYNGAPFGLSIVTPAVAGPFNLGEVVVRSGIYVEQDDGCGHDQHHAAHVRELGSAPEHGDPAAAARDQRRRGPPELRVQPDQLHADVGHRHARGGRRSDPSRVRAVPGRQLLGVAVPPDADSLDAGQRQQTQRCELDREGLLEQRTGEHRENQARAADPASIAFDDDPESVPGLGVRSQPGELRRRLEHRHGDRAHAGAEEPADGPRLSRLAWKRSIPGCGVRAAGRRDHADPRRADRHQKRHYDVDLQRRARCARDDV